MTRFPLFALAFALAALLMAGCAESSPSGNAATNASGDDLPQVTFYKSASCPCCVRWAEHMKQAGFSVETVNRPDMGAAKKKLGVPGKLRSCHTAEVGGEVIEGHVPALAVKGYLRGDEKVRAQGLAVPGMPIGSPGMEMANRPADAYRVIAFKKDGRTGVYSRHNQ